MLNMSVANACIRGSLFDLDEPPSIPGRAEAVHTLQLHQLPLQTEDAPRQLIAIEDAPEWSEAAVVQLHWVLLQELKKLTDPETPLEGKHILLVEDIIDTGRTMKRLVSVLGARRPASLAICALLDKERLPEPLPELRWVGFTAPPAFLVGYGLDHAEDYRHLPFIGDLIDG